MSRLSFVLPAAAMLMAGVAFVPAALAAPAAGVAIKAAASQGSDVTQVGWWDRHRHSRHNGRGDHDRGHRWGHRDRDHDRGHRWGRNRDHDGHHWGRRHDRDHRWGGRHRDRYDG